MNALLLALALVAPTGELPVLPACPVDFVIVEPERPTSQDEVELHVGGDCPNGCFLQAPFVMMEGNKIDVIIDSFVCLTTPEDWGTRATLGRLPAGTYDVRIIIGRAEAARRTLTVEKAPFRVYPAFGAEGTEVAVLVPDFGTCPTAPCPELRVTFGGVPGTIKGLVGANRLLVVAPAHAPGRVDVAVTNYSGQTSTAPGAFLYPEPFADLTAEYERVIFPSVFSGPGAHGSHWTTENVVTSRAAVPMPSLPVAVPNGARVALPTLGRDGGLLFYVPRGFMPWLSFASHARDVSRSTRDAGTELPVVRAEDTSNVVRILGIPVDATSRRLLRVYDFDAVDGRVVSVSLTPAGGGTPVGRGLVLHDRIVCVTTPCYPDRPTWAALALDDLPAGVYDLELRGFPDDARIWGFVTVTNNDTQHVTTYIPQ